MSLKIMLLKLLQHLPESNELISELLSHLYAELILGLRPANERGRYKVTPSLIGWAQT